MSYFAIADLKNIGFRNVGKDVRVSDKASIYNADQITIGDYSRIDDFCVLSGKIDIGQNVHISVFSNISGANFGIQINDYAGLAYGCHIIAQSDDYSGEFMTNPTIPAKFTAAQGARVVIGRHCILGTGTIVLPGVTIAEGVASGAQTLFRKSTEPWSIYVGSPARKLRKRKRDLLELAKKLEAEKNSREQ